MPETDAIRNRVAEIGARFDPQVLKETRALYTPLVEKQKWLDGEVIRNAAYGDHGRNRLDIYPADTADAPVLLFVHGGGFVAGDKQGDGVFYSNVGRYFAHAGFCTVAMNYRLAPDHGWPAGPQDVNSAIGWIRGNIAKHGGDPERLMVLGQSAGASHVASFLFDPQVAAEHRGAVSRAALVGGFYAAEPPLHGGPALYFGDDVSLWRQRSPATHVHSPHVQLLLAIGQFDPVEIADQSYILARALNRADAAPPNLVWLEGENHVSSMFGLGLGVDRHGRLLRRFFDAP